MTKGAEANSHRPRDASQGDMKEQLSLDNLGLAIGSTDVWGPVVTEPVTQRSGGPPDSDPMPRFTLWLQALALSCKKAPWTSPICNLSDTTAPGVRPWDPECYSPEPSSGSLSEWITVRGVGGRRPHGPRSVRGRRDLSRSTGLIWSVPTGSF